MKKSRPLIGVRRKAVNNFIEEEELNKIMHEEEKKITNSKVVAYSNRMGYSQDKKERIP